MFICVRKRSNAVYGCAVRSYDLKNPRDAQDVVLQDLTLESLLPGYLDAESEGHAGGWETRAPESGDEYHGGDQDRQAAHH